MAIESSRPGVRTISLDELPRLIAQAKAESWRELALIGQLVPLVYEPLGLADWPKNHIFRLSTRLTDAGTLASLTDLNSLNLFGNRIGDEGARALASLTGLTSLNLVGNQIGAEGARALASLTGLNSLNLSSNEIGDEGARALASLTGLTSLELPFNQIGAEGARALASLTGLNSLELTLNQIGAEGACALASLTGLNSLELFGNQIGAEGAGALASLTGLNSLNLGSNQIGAEGVRALASLTGLNSLELFGNQIGAEGARSLASLAGLNSLDLGSNQIGDEGARALTSLTGLNSLNLSSNQIGAEGARLLTSLTGLNSLNLSSNQIGEEGARALASLTGLNLLYLSHNEIGPKGARALLDAWCKRPDQDAIRYLDIRKNGDLSGVLPAEAIETLDAQAILAAYRRVLEDASGRRPLHQARLLVVGNEAVGKTSLIRYLVDGLPRDPSEARTPGAEMREKIETHSWAPQGCPVRLNVWDFGGQEIYHQTHKFFLAARSLFLLVLEARREDDRSYLDWLKTIRNRAGDAPVIVVINKCDGQHRNLLQIDQTRLQQDWPSIVGFVRTSCDPGDEPAAMIQSLRETIVGALNDDRRLKHVRDPVPQAWLTVKENMAQLAQQRQVLDIADFQRLCSDATVTDADEQRAVLRVLHHLGTIVAHGLDELGVTTSMKHVTLLDPNWLTTAIYSVITYCRGASLPGEFSRADLSRILDPQRYPPDSDSYDFVLDMMQHEQIRLCFELPGGPRGRYLLPEALPVNEPHYDDIWPADSLRFRYRYDFLPTGLIPQFIVQTHRNLTDHPTRWRTGVVLQAAGCKVLVRADVDRRTVEIAVTGPANRHRDALNVVINDLEAVHRRNPGLKQQPRVPLPDRPELDVSYAHLLTLEDEEGPQHAYRPEGADRRYTVAELLNGVRLERALADPRAAVWQDKRGPQDPAHAGGMSIVAGDGASFVFADQISDRARVSQGGSKQRSSSEPDPAPTGLAAWGAWPYFSLAGGAAAMLLAVVLWLLPSNEWRAMVGVPLAIGAIVTAWLLRLNPRWYYRRWLSFVIPAGLLVNSLGVTAEIFYQDPERAGGFHWDSAVSGWFFAAWAVVIIGLIIADLRQNPGSRSLK